MHVEIEALVHKDCSQPIIDTLRGAEGIDAMFIETARSNDLFEDRQFGEFGEAAVVTLLVDEAHKDHVFDRLFEACDLHSKAQGVIFMSESLIRIG